MAQTDASISDFDEIRFVHDSIPSIDVSDVNLEHSLKISRSVNHFILMR